MAVAQGGAQVFQVGAQQGQAGLHLQVDREAPGGVELGVAGVVGEAQREGGDEETLAFEVGVGDPGLELLQAVDLQVVAQVPTPAVKAAGGGQGAHEAPAVDEGLVLLLLQSPGHHQLGLAPEDKGHLPAPHQALVDGRDLALEGQEVPQTQEIPVDLEDADPEQVLGAVAQPQPQAVGIALAHQEVHRHPVVLEFAVDRFGHHVGEEPAVQECLLGLLQLLEREGLPLGEGDLLLDVTCADLAVADKAHLAEADEGSRVDPEDHHRLARFGRDPHLPLHLLQGAGLVAQGLGQLGLGLLVVFQAEGLVFPDGQVAAQEGLPEGLGSRRGEEQLHRGHRGRLILPDNDGDVDPVGGGEVIHPAGQFGVEVAIFLIELGQAHLVAGQLQAVEGGGFRQAQDPGRLGLHHRPRLGGAQVAQALEGQHSHQPGLAGLGGGSRRGRPLVAAVGPGRGGRSGQREAQGQEEKPAGGADPHRPIGYGCAWRIYFLSLAGAGKRPAAGPGSSMVSD